MTKKVKLRATITWTYEADPKYYETADPDEMAKIDQEQEDIEAMVSMGLDKEDFSFTVKPEIALSSLSKPQGGER